MQKLRVGVVEDSAKIASMITDYFTNEEDFEIVFVAGDGLSAVAEIERLEPDIVLLDIILPDLDGFGVMENAQSPHTKYIILSALSQESFVAKALRQGASYFMIKPFDFEILKRRMYDIGVSTPRKMTLNKLMDNISTDYQEGMPVSKTLKSRHVEERITNIFITVGIPAHIKGYQFLREAIKLAIDNPEIINCITKKLYPSIADRFTTSASKVERAIRHAIEVAWNRGKIENINTLFGVKVYTNNEKPTNGEFIALVADKMLIEGA